MTVRDIRDGRQSDNYVDLSGDLPSGPSRSFWDFPGSMRLPGIAATPVPTTGNFVTPPTSTPSSTPQPSAIQQLNNSLDVTPTAQFKWYNLMHGARQKRYEDERANTRTPESPGQMGVSIQPLSRFEPNEPRGLMGSTPQGAKMSNLDPVDRDMMIRTVLGEARNQAPVGQAAVAHVILNRVKSPKFAGDTPTDVVLAKGQFEPWQTRKAELLRIPTTDPAYQRAARIVDAVASGAPDPTGGATNFANVQTVKDRNGGTVGNHTWINPANATATIGAHTFYAPAGRVASTEGEPFAYAPDTTPAKAPALDAIKSATKGTSMADDGADPLAAFKKMLADHATAQQQVQQTQNPLRGILGRALHHGLTSMFPGLGAPNAPQAFPPAAQPAPFNAAADLPGGTNSDVPIPLPPERPTDLGDAAGASLSPPAVGASAAPASALAGNPIDLSGQNTGLSFPGMGADQNSPSPAFAANDAPGAGFGSGMGGLAALFGLA